ncbi:PREDICTED: collagen alpha-1(I) chain-like [Branchiostoma belcheri]|uniref:Collagen alpha-1(I) chain-like n=1 Tax=Branchiostoma belcheri TaxID=7741 RepID=A0A6P4YF09_BRABE|nr:PREDICTED: collagen alpha-1(I) chain-like [Branchiostoma belcheri]
MEREVDTAREIATVPPPFLTQGVGQGNAQNVSVSRRGAKEPSQDGLACLGEAGAVDLSNLKTSANPFTAAPDEAAGRKLVPGLPSKSRPTGDSPLVVPSDIRERAETTEDGTQASPQKIAAFDRKDDGMEEYMLVAGSTSPTSAETQEPPGAGGMGATPQRESPHAKRLAGGTGPHDHAPDAETNAGGGVDGTPEPKSLQGKRPGDCKDDNGVEEYMLVAGSSGAASAETQERPGDGGIVATPEPESPDAARPVGGTGLHNTPPGAETTADGGIGATPKPQADHSGDRKDNGVEEYMLIAGSTSAASAETQEPPDDGGIVATPEPESPDAARPAGGTGLYDTPPDAVTIAGGGVDGTPEPESPVPDGERPAGGTGQHDVPPVAGTNAGGGVEGPPGPAEPPHGELLAGGTGSHDTPPGAETTAGGGVDEGPARGSAHVDGPDPTLAAARYVTGTSTDKSTVIGRLFRRVTSRPRPVCLVVTSVVMATLIIAVILFWMHLSSQHAMVRFTPHSGGQGTGKAATARTGTGSGSTGKPESTRSPWNESGSGNTSTPEVTEPEGTDSGGESTGIPDATKPTVTEDESGNALVSAGTTEATDPDATESGGWSTGNPESTEPAGTGSGSGTSGDPEATKEAPTVATSYKTIAAAAGNEGVPNGTVEFVVSSMGRPLAARGASVSPGGELFLCLPLAKRVKVYSMRGIFLHDFRTSTGHYLADGFRVMRPEDIATDKKGNVWVVGSENGHGWVVQYSREGRVLRTFGLGGGKFYNSRGIAVDRYNGEVMVTGDGESAVKVYRPDGHLGRSWGGGKFYNSRGIAVDRYNGKVMVTGDGKSAVRVYRPDGHLLREFGRRELKAPLRIAVGPDPRGRVFLSDPFSHEVFAFTHYGWYVDSGGFLFLIKKYRFGGVGAADGLLNRPQGLCTGPDRTVIVADKENRRVQVFTYDGKHVRTVPTGGRPYAVAVGPAGQLVVTNDVSGSIGIYPTY